MRRPPPGLDPDAIVAAALAIADADGLDALTMRRLAGGLGVTPMAIYHHVANKDQLLDLMADTSLGALPQINARANPATELARFFSALHGLHLAHPVLAQAMTQRPLEGPHAVVFGERVLTLLTRAGLRDDEAVGALITLVNYTTGASLYRLSRRTRSRGRLTDLAEADAPLAHRMRRRIAAAADSDRQFADGIKRILASYLPPVSPR